MGFWPVEASIMLHNTLLDVYCAAQTQGATFGARKGSKMLRFVHVTEQFRSTFEWAENVCVDEV